MEQLHRGVVRISSKSALAKSERRFHLCLEANCSKSDFEYNEKENRRFMQTIVLLYCLFCLHVRAGLLV
jgi:hypothetical protein